MTIIAAVRDPGQRCTWIGADSRATSGGATMPITCRKLRIEGRYAIGSSGWSSAMTCVNTLPGLFDGEPTAGEVAARIGNAIRALPWDSDSEGGPHSYGCYFVLVIGSAVYDIDSAFDVGLIDDGQLWARGSGGQFAVGAGYALRNHRPERRLREALKAACQFDQGCGGRLVVERVPWE